MPSGRLGHVSVPCRPVPTNLYVQRDQPPGVPPLELTGERTLPDVPAENYWYRRHLAVYEWIGARVIGRRVLDMACGEGYGSEVLVALGGERRRGRRQPRGLRARAAALPAPEPELRARDGREPRGARRLRRGGVPADDRARPGPRRGAAPLPLAAGAGRHRLRVDAQPADAGAAGGRRSPTTRGTSRNTGPRSSSSCAARCSPRCELLGLFHARKLRAARAGAGLGWDAVHARLRITKPFYDRFTPAIASSDFALRETGLDGALDFLAVCESNEGVR